MNSASVVDDSCGSSSIILVGPGNCPFEGDCGASSKGMLLVEARVRVVSDSSRILVVGDGSWPSLLEVVSRLVGDVAEGSLVTILVEVRIGSAISESPVVVENVGSSLSVMTMSVIIGVASSEDEIGSSSIKVLVGCEVSAIPLGTVVVRDRSSPESIEVGLGSVN